MIQKLDPGTVHTFKQTYYRDQDDELTFMQLQHISTASVAEYAERDGVGAVSQPGGPDVVYVIKVLAVVRRSAQVQK